MMRNIKTREGYDYWDKLCAIPRHGFVHSPDGSRVLKVEGIGNWIDQHAAQEVVDAAQDDVNELRHQRDQLAALLQKARDYVAYAFSEGMDGSFTLGLDIDAALATICAAAPNIAPTSEHSGS